MLISEEQILNSKILIVDDNYAVVDSLTELLGVAGYRHVYSTSDSRKTLILFKEISPDLILLDLTMPHLNGFQVMEILKASHPQSYLPIIVLTSDDSKEVRQQALQYGAKDFLYKTTDSTETLARIRNMLEIRALYNYVKDENNVLETKVTTRTRELYETQLEIVHRLALAAEYQDNDTGDHIKRMSGYCAILGKTSGMSERECELFRNASQLHDIGKIGVPDIILRKTGKLLPDEWEVMKSHSAIGAKILSGSLSPLLQMAEQIALTHHERWDGSGYPRGLKGEEIPLVSRISTICDVFDALTSPRPYKRAWSSEEAVEEIHKQEGLFFDPKVVKLFDDSLPNLIKLKEAIRA